MSYEYLHRQNWLAEPGPILFRKSCGAWDGNDTTLRFVLGEFDNVFGQETMIEHLSGNEKT